MTKIKNILVNYDSQVLQKKPDNIYMFKVNDRTTTESCEICSNMFVLEFLSLTLNIFHTVF